MPPVRTLDVSGGQPYGSSATGLLGSSNVAPVCAPLFQPFSTTIIPMPVSWLSTKLVCLTAPCQKHAHGRFNRYWMTISCQKSCLSFLHATSRACLQRVRCLCVNCRRRVRGRADADAVAYRSAAVWGAGVH